MEEKKMPYILLVVYTIIEILITVGYIIRNQYGGLWQATVIYILYVLSVYLGKKKSILVQNYIQILILTTIVVHVVMGNFFMLYQNSNHFDSGLHAVGAFSFSLFVYSVFNQKIHLSYYSKTSRFIFIILIGLGIGAAFEILEYTLDQLFHQNNQKGLLDTNMDLIFNMIGAILAGIFLIMYKKKNV